MICMSEEKLDLLRNQCARESLRSLQEMDLEGNLGDPIGLHSVIQNRAQDDQLTIDCASGDAGSPPVKNVVIYHGRLRLA